MDHPKFLTIAQLKVDILHERYMLSVTNRKYVLITLTEFLGKRRWKSLETARFSELSNDLWKAELKSFDS